MTTNHSQQNPHSIIIIPADNDVKSLDIAPPEGADEWYDYFDRPAAYKSVMDHVGGLGSADTPEKHTKKAYVSGLNYFLERYADDLPTEALIIEFIRHLREERELSSSTVNSKYLAPLRHYLRALRSQFIRATGVVREFVEDCRLAIMLAVEVKGPKKEKTSNDAPVEQHGERLTQGQVERVLGAIDTDTLKGKRDQALMYVAFNTGLRVAELSRITLNSIRRDGDHYEIRVRGKRNNYSPVPLDAKGYELICTWVEAYNLPLTQDDPRYIDADTPIWQPLQHNDTHHPLIGTNAKFERGISTQSISRIISERSEAGCGVRISPHDCRRTVATIMRNMGAAVKDIQRLLRHQSVATTDGYIGEPKDLSRSLLTKYVRFAF